MVSASNTDLLARLTREVAGVERDSAMVPLLQQRLRIALHQVRCQLLHSSRHGQACRYSNAAKPLQWPSQLLQLSSRRSWLSMTRKPSSAA